MTTVVTCIYQNDSVYIPIGTLLKELKINETVDLKDSTLSGFFVLSSVPYEVNFRKGKGKVGERLIEFDSARVIIGQLDFYVLPSLIKELFDLDFIVDLSSLTLSLNTTMELPIATEYQREARRSYVITAPGASLIQAPLAYPRDRSMLNGGVLDYSLSAFLDKGKSSYNYDFSGGGEVLGGETDGSVFGNISSGKSSLQSSDLGWKYVFDSTNYITYAGAGNLYSNGLTQYGFRGAQISNEPVTLRTVFSNYAIDAKTNPNWDVELYLNGQLVGYTKADAGGNAHFTIPLVYGTSVIQLKYYGPSGEVVETERRLQIPFTFVPAGQITYTVGGGKLNNSNDNFLSGDAAMGVADWLTDKIGSDYVEDPLFSEPLFFNSVSARFSSEYMMSIDAAPSAFYRSAFNGTYASQTSFDVMYSRYETNLLYNPSDKLQDAQVDCFVPIAVPGGSLNLRAVGIGQEYAGGQRSFSYSGFVNSSLGQFNASIGYLQSVFENGGGPSVKSYGISASVLYSLLFEEGGLAFLNGGLVGMSTRYGVLKNSPDDIQMEFSKSIHSYFRFQIAAERDFLNKFTVFSLQIIADLPFTRSTTSAQIQNKESWVTENITGSVGFDSNHKYFSFNDLGWSGHSGASVRMFVDNNNDGVYDDGDDLIGGGSVILRQSVLSELSSDGITREWNLLPYTQYSADIDLSSIKNPLLIPKEKSFSFVTDPNSYKEIDVPFFAGGIVDGTVLKTDGTTTTAIPGLTIKIRSLSSAFQTSLSVFNDGTFYYMGLLPGRYEASVDSSQLAMLGVEADPPVLNFEVKNSKSGDFVEGLKIILRGKELNPIPAITATTTVKTDQLPEKPPEVKIPPTAVVSIPNKEKFVIQISAFKGRQDAERFAARATKKTKERLNISLDENSKLYVVESDTIETIEDAMQKLSLFRYKSQYKNAFIMDSTGKRIFP